MNAKKTIATLGAAGIMTVGLGVAPASAAPVVTGGLVNVTVTDVLNDNVVTALNGVTLQVAAQVCGVSVSVLAADLAPDGIAVCDTDMASNTETTVTQRRRR